MTKDHKSAAILGGVFLVLILLLLFTRKSASNTTVMGAGQDIPANTVGLGDAIAGFTMPEFGPIIIPGINLSGERDLSIIGACCSDCAAPRQTDYSPAGSGNTFVFNAPNNGPTNYSYTTTQTVAEKPWWSLYASAPSPTVNW